MIFLGIAFWLLIGAGLRGAYEHSKAERQRSADQRLKAAAKNAPGGKLPKAQQRKALRRHTAGWWTREVARGFPVTRTGFHAGYLAHQTASAHQEHLREEARTANLETQAAFAPAMKEHRKRQEAARAEILETLGQAPEGQRTGRKAAQRAADEVAAKRAEKEKRQSAPNDTTGTCIHCGATDGTECLPGCPYREGDWRTVARNTKEYRKNGRSGGIPETARPCRFCGAAVGEECRPGCPAVIDTPVRVHNAEDSGWLRPGEPRCEGCGGSGRNADGTDACPACRGFGSAPASPDSPLAGLDAVCGACGHGHRPGDAVLAAQGGYNTHRSHATEQTAAYQDALGRMRQQENEPGPDAARSPQPVESEIDDAVIAADHGYEGEYELAPSPTTTEGAPMADTNYATVLADAKAAADQADQDAVAAAQRRATAEQHAEAMQAANVKGNCLGAQMELVDQLRIKEEIAKAAGEQAQAVSDHLQREHGGIQAAVDDSPIDAPAEPAFYSGS